MTLKKRIGMVGNPAVLAPDSKDNTGNIIHGHAARHLFGYAPNLRVDTSEENIERLRNEFTHVGFVAATNLHVRNPPSYIEGQVHIADFIEKLDLPVCVFGFGCHASLGDTISAAKVDPRSVRLLQVLAERSGTVGVRGTFTADLCSKYGVKNVNVVGCQSAYVAALLNTDRRELKTAGEKPVVNFSWGADERPMLRMAVEADADVIGQNDYSEERIAHGLISREAFHESGADNWLLSFYLEAIEGGVTRLDYHDYMKTHFHKFYNVADWHNHISQNYDFCVGTRFHGNMAALQAGVPALWIEHDMRTRELCAHLGLPSVPCSSLNDYTDLKQLAAECTYDTFWSKMPELARGFLDYLSGNGVGDLLSAEVSEGLQSLAAGRGS